MDDDLVNKYKHLLKPGDAEQIRRLPVKEASRIHCALVMFDAAINETIKGSNIKMEFGRSHLSMTVETVTHLDRITSKQFAGILPQVEAA